MYKRFLFECKGPELVLDAPIITTSFSGARDAATKFARLWLGVSMQRLACAAATVQLALGDDIDVRQGFALIEGDESGNINVLSSSVDSAGKNFDRPKSLGV